MDVKILLNAFQKSYPSADKKDVGLIEKAYNFSQKAHQGQKRRTGEPYFNHCFETALQLANWKMDATAVSAGLLHDVAEDTSFSLDKIREEFGEEISFLVDGITKLGHLKYRTSEEKQAENIRKMLLSISRDLRVVIIKLADRLHNMKTLGVLPPASQKRISLETSEIYAPLAYRLGMQSLAGELEDLAFMYLQPKEYHWLLENVKERYEERQKYLERARPVMEKAVKESGIKPVKIDLRAKRYSSLYKKLLRYDMNLDQIYDLVAMRIIVSTISDCYAVLGAVHHLWPPLPGKIKDYIALPKPNGYRSLHTTVFSLEGKPIEIQIRTEEMHEESENGIAAHWAYHQKKGAGGYLKRLPIFADKKEIIWVEQLRNWQKEFSDPEEFMKSLKVDFFQDRIFAITPRGEVKDLPAGSTPVDFAYSIHSDVGNQCTGAKVNGKIVALDCQLQSGDIVDIMVQKSKRPSESWLGFVKSSYAKKKIKSALNRSALSMIRDIRKETEFSIVAAENRIGLLKDISATVSRSRVNIIKATMAEGKNGLSAIKIRCDLGEKKKAESLLLKIKKIDGVKEINYKLV
jgi:GTP pyrophosphokinase